MKLESKSRVNFIGIGAQKSGTTWLFNNLKKLPDFSLLPIKELHYFDRHPKYPSSTALYHDSIFKRIKNPDWQFGFRIYFRRTFRNENLESKIWKLKYFLKKANDKRYLSFFENLKGLKGEVTPSYSILEVEDIQKMYHLAPDAKLILLLRNPIYRAWSNYSHIRRKSGVPENQKIDIEDAIQFMNSEHQTRRSDYEQTIKNYLSVYPKAQLLLGFYDALSENPLQLIENVVDFVGGNSEHISEHLDVHERFNSQKKIEMPREVFEFLKTKYRKPIERMARDYGGYCKVWLEEIYGVKSEHEASPRSTIRF